jgi:hypothetical protein
MPEAQTRQERFEAVKAELAADAIRAKKMEAVLAELRAEGFTSKPDLAERLLGDSLRFLTMKDGVVVGASDIARTRMPRGYRTVW